MLIYKAMLINTSGMFCSSGCCMCFLLLGCCQCKAVNSPTVAELQVGRCCRTGWKTQWESIYLIHDAAVIFVIRCRHCITLQLVVSESYRDFHVSPDWLTFKYPASQQLNISQLLHCFFDLVWFGFLFSKGELMLVWELPDFGWVVPIRG